MAYYQMITETLKSAKDSLRGYCRGLSRDSCRSRLQGDINEAFRDFGISMDAFLEYPMFALKKDEATYMKEGKPWFSGKTSISYLTTNIDPSKLNPQSDQTPYQTLPTSTTMGYEDGKNWPFSAMVGKFTNNTKTGQWGKTYAGMLSFDSNYSSLGICNFGFSKNQQAPPRYVFYDECLGDAFQFDPDPGCEGTYYSKASSIINKKFNCYYGMKWTDEDIDSLEILAVRNPGHAKEDVFFDSPSYPYQTTNRGIWAEDKLYDVEEGNPLFYNPEIDKLGCPLNLGEQSVMSNSSVLDHLTDFAMATRLSVLKKVYQPNTMTKVAKKIGKTIVNCLGYWITDNANETEDCGDKFADNMTYYLYNFFSEEDNYNEIGLSYMVDFRTFIKAFFYSSMDSHYYRTRNTAAETTFKQLFNDKSQTSGIDCDGANKGLCSVYKLLGMNAAMFVDDFRLSAKLFDLFYIDDLLYPIPGVLYVTDKYIDEANTGDDYIASYPTNTMFERYLISKNDSLRNLGYPIFGVRTESGEYNDSTPILAVTYNSQSFAEPVNYRARLMSVREKGIKFVEGFMIWPLIPHSKSNYTMLIYGFNSATGAWPFLPYTTQPFNVTSKIISFGNEYNVGDRYYRMSEEELRDGYNKSYRTVWIFGNNDIGISRNMTDFRKCLPDKPVSQCLDEFLPWYDSCANSAIEDQMSCQVLKDALKSVGLLKEDGKDSKGSSNIPIIVAAVLTITAVICIIAVVIAVKRIEKGKEKSSMSDLYEQI